MDDYAMYSRASEIFVTPEIEGYLTEKKLMRNAKTWCSLQGATLYLQKSQGASIQTVDMATEVQSIRKLGESPAQFEINGKKGKQTFVCSDPSDCTKWVTALQSAMSLRSNGIGRSIFHAPSLDDNPYALPSDDGAQQETEVPPPEAVYADIDPQPPSSSQSGTDRNSHRPPLPSMESRLLRAQAGQDCVPSSSDSEPPEGEYTDISSVQKAVGDEMYTDGFTPQENSEEYTDGFTPQENSEEYTDGFTPQENSEEYADGLSHANPEQASPEYRDGLSTINCATSIPGSPVTLRTRSSRSSSLFLEKSPENGIDIPDSSKDQEEEDEARAADAFAELEQALTSPETPDLTLKCPLTEEDYQPAKRLHEFLANNSQLLNGVSSRRLLLDPVQDPVASLKMFLQQIQL